MPDWILIVAILAFILAFIIGALVGAAFLLVFAALYDASEHDERKEAEMQRAVDGARR